MKERKTFWRIIAKALGEKSGKNDQEADQIAFIRLIIMLQIITTNCFIIYGVLRTHHFPIHYEISSDICQTKEKGILKTNSSLLQR